MVASPLLARAFESTRCWPLLIAASLAASLHAQPCTPTLVGLPSGPQHVNISDFPSSIYDLEVYDDGTGPALIAGGLFMIPPVDSTNPLLVRRKIARLHNGQWTAMDIGLPISSTTYYVTSLAQIDVPQDTPDLRLFAAGNSGQVYGLDPTNNTWTLTGPGLPVTSNSQPVLFAHQDAQGPVLLAAGSYSAGVMAWRGSGSWQPYAPLTVGTGAIHRLRVIDEGSGPTLFAVGSFRDNTRNIATAAMLVNGQWQQFPPLANSTSSVSDIIRWDDGTNGMETYIIGSICGANGCGVLRYRNGSWQSVHGGVSLAFGGANPQFFIHDEGSGPQLYIGGNISSPNQFQFIARYTPTGWQSPVFLSANNPSVGGVTSIVRFDDGHGPQTYIGGLFSAFRYVSHNQFIPAPTYGLMRGTDSAFETAAQGLGEPSNFSASNTRYDLIPLTFQGVPQLFAGGPFSRAGGQSAFGAALFNGQNWTPLSMTPVTSWQPAQGATVATINGQERLVAIIPNSSLGPVAYWDGAAWVRLPGNSPLGGQPIKLFNYSNQLYALTPTGIQVYINNLWQSTPAVGSAFNGIQGDLGQGERIYFTASGPTGPGVYDFNGLQSARVGPTTPGTPQSLVIHDDGSGPALYVTGPFQGFIAKQTSSGWIPLGTGLSANTTNIALASFDDGQGPALYAAGTFTMAGGVSTPGLAKWKDNAWHTWPVLLPPPTTNYRHSMAVFNDRLYIAGDFVNIGPVQADHLAYIQACPRTCTADYNSDGDIGADSDIEAFFRCLAGNCCTRCSQDFNNDGDLGDDADIESFFRVLAGGPC